MRPTSVPFAVLGLALLLLGACSGGETVLGERDGDHEVESEVDVGAEQGDDGDADTGADAGADGDGDGDGDADADADADGDADGDVDADAGCTSDLECDDGLSCTLDTCDLTDRTCGSFPLDTECDDGLVCNGTEFCDAMFGPRPSGCRAGTPMDCDDDDDCTVDVCDESARSCTHVMGRDADGDTHVDAACGGDDCNDGDATVGTCDSCGTWYDSTTGHLWQNLPLELARGWDYAVTYCNALSLCGYPEGSWRLPTISEMRTIIRGCPDTMTGGACDIDDSCVPTGCSPTDCAGCSREEGPGAEGCYWDPELIAPCGVFWSSSLPFPPPYDVYDAFHVDFSTGFVYFTARTDRLQFRCVRGEP